MGKTNSLYQCLGEEGTIGFFRGVVAAEREARRQTEMGEVGPLYVAVSPAHEVKAKVVGGQPTVNELVGYPLVMLKAEPSLRWWVMGKPWLSSRTGWPWSALSVHFRQRCLSHSV